MSHLRGEEHKGETGWERKQRTDSSPGSGVPGEESSGICCCYRQDGRMLSSAIFCVMALSHS